MLRSPRKEDKSRTTLISSKSTNSWSYKVALLFDFTIAYNSILTGLVERHTCRFWMKISQEEEWCEYAFNVVQFGDKPAAAIMQIAVERASENWEAVVAMMNMDPDVVN